MPARKITSSTRFFLLFPSTTALNQFSRYQRSIQFLTLVSIRKTHILISDPN